MTEDDEKAVQFIFDACRHFGASLVTAHKVCAVVAQHMEYLRSTVEVPA